MQFVRQGQQPRDKDQEIGFLQMLDSRDVVLLELILAAFLRENRQGGIDSPGFVKAEKDGAMKALVLGKDDGKHH